MNTLNIWRIGSLLVFTAGMTAATVDQAMGLRTYAGHWVSSESVAVDTVGERPQIRMFNHSVMGGRSLQVEVEQWTGEAYETILTELISHDVHTDRIHAFGQNAEGVSFKGSGQFLNESTWEMEDVDMRGEHYLSVKFEFQDRTDVVLTGTDSTGQVLWETRYIKANPRDKNIGVQLVSVHDDMLEDPTGTLRKLGRMGYSYVETFVYQNGQFYGMSPVEFRREVESAGMEFLGSMVVMDAPSPRSWASSKQWWENCVSDHVAAGVKYLTVSNHILKEVRSLAEVKGFCDYYNELGRLCRAQGVTLAFHNHADEFREVEGTLIYDYLLAHTDPAYVFFQPDIYWMSVGGVDPRYYLEKYGDRILSWHVKDYKELGASGKIDWLGLFQNEQVKLPRYLVAEVEDYSFPPLHSIQLAWEHLYYVLLRR